MPVQLFPAEDTIVFSITLYCFPFDVVYVFPNLLIATPFDIKDEFSKLLMDAPPELKDWLPILVVISPSDDVLTFPNELIFFPSLPKMNPILFRQMVLPLL